MMNSAFIRLLPRFVEKIDLDGITFKDTNRKIDVAVKKEVYSVPIFKIINAKNIPFSYSSVKDLLVTDLEETLKPITSSKFDYNDIFKLIIFDDFSSKDFYIPLYVFEDFKNCADGLEYEFSYRIVNKIYTIKYKYIIDSDFDWYWEDSETAKVDISINVESIFFEDLSKKEFFFLDKSQYQEVVDDLNYRSPESFENGIWPCITVHLREYKTLLNPDWQFYIFNIIFKENLT